ncbi:MAG: hypothetical protein R3F49_24755 [Planctomycetota bacterium]
MTTTSQTAFIALAARHGVIADLADDALPTRVRAWRGQDLALPDEGTPSSVRCWQRGARV